MRDRNIRRKARFGGKRDAYQIGRQVIKAVGFCINSHHRRGFNALDPRLKRLFIKNSDVAFRGERDGLFFRLRLDDYCFTRLRGRFATGLEPFAGFEIGRPALKFVLPEEREQFIGQRLLHFKAIVAQLQLYISFNSRQLVREVRHVFVLLKLRRHSFGAAERELSDFLRVGVKRVQTAEALQQRLGGFLADTRHARNVIGRITHQRQEVDDKLRRHAILRADFFRPQHGVGHGVDKRDVWRDKLRHVFIAGADEHRAASGGGFFRERADNVIRLHARNRQ